MSVLQEELHQSSLLAGTFYILSLSLVCVSRINIEIGRSFIHRSFPRRVEYQYLSERECQARDETRKTLRLGSRFPHPTPLPPPSFPSHPSSFSLRLLVLLAYLRLTFVVALLEGSPLLFRGLLFAAFTPTPCLFYPWLAPVFFLRFSLFVDGADGVRFFLGGARLTIGQGANSSTFQPFRTRVTPRSVPVG